MSLTLALLCHLVSLYVLDRNKYQPKPSQQTVKNPYKGKRRVKDESKIPADVREKYTRLILDVVLYEAEECQALREFEPVKVNTHCIFAKKSIFWGARDYDKSLSLGKSVKHQFNRLQRNLYKLKNHTLPHTHL